MFLSKEAGKIIAKKHYLEKQKKRLSHAALPKTKILEISKEDPNKTSQI